MRGPLGEASVDAEVDATYDLRPPPLTIAVYLLPFLLVGGLWLKLLLRLKRGVATGRVPLMGVKRSFAGGLLGGMVALAMIQSLNRHARPKGMQRAELSWILEDNRPMRRMIEELGATAYKTYRVYEKQLN